MVACFVVTNATRLLNYGLYNDNSTRARLSKLESFSATEQSMDDSTDTPSKGLRASAGAMLVAAAIPLLAATAQAQDEASLRAADEAQMQAGARGDADAYRALTLPDFTVNAPNNRISSREQVLSRLASGEIASEQFERTIEHVLLHGDVGIVMGRETITPASGSISGRAFGQGALQRRFTNVFVFEDGQWRFLARHANVAPDIGDQP